MQSATTKSGTAQTMSIGTATKRSRERFETRRIFFIVRGAF
jgi:hypothetical protein